MAKHISDFFLEQKRFEGLSPAEQMTRLAWYLHNERGIETFTNADVAALYKELNLKVPQISVYLPRLAKRSPPILIARRGRYLLEGRERGRLDDILKEHPHSIRVSHLLSSLVDRIENDVESSFLSETMKCYRSGAFRSAIVMVWNLGFYHLRDWVWADRSRIDIFNDGIKKRFPKTTLQVVNLIDFDELKESEFIEICKSSKLIHKNVAEMLNDKLKRRNAAAHPSSVTFTQMQADDVITDIINNVLLAL